jgi:tetraacyldisaccharide 4'-kinase
MISLLLTPFSWLYGLIIIIRNWFFDAGILTAERIGAQVYSVGNITVGGTGKTPIVSNIVTHLLDDGMRPAVISRGYRRKSSGTVVVSDGKNILVTVEDSGDEPMMLAERFRNVVVIVDSNRVRAARRAVDEFGVNVIVLDDGFQHRYLQRDKNIVLIDSNISPNDIKMIPAGYRREPISSLRRADSVVFTKVENKNIQNLLERNIIESKKNVFTSSVVVKGLRNVANGIIQSVDILKGHSVIAFSGIAKPENFLKSLQSVHADVKEFMTFRDHHAFSERDIEKILAIRHRHNAEIIITTEKDGVRLKKHLFRFAGVPLLSLYIESVVHQEFEWNNFLAEGNR